ncbi:MAG: 50S ribosome-binding GTPase [Deltaproteobacteria bacterium]|nr:50S ribosome-binding GTPase [Deltaproteobacteria bacterium]
MTGSTGDRLERIRGLSDLLRGVRTAGLIPSCGTIPLLAENLLAKAAAYAHRIKRSYLVIIFAGGTGTGKSTLFNALCGTVLSAAGSARPTTSAPVVYAHRIAGFIETRPFDIPAVFTPAILATNDTSNRENGGWSVIEHERQDFRHLALIDTPDVDSLVKHHKSITEKLALMADAVVFVTSQEKYADAEPLNYLANIAAEKIPWYVLFNKTDPRANSTDCEAILETKGIPAAGTRLFVIPYIVPMTPESIEKTEEFRRFSRLIQRELSPSRTAVELSKNRRRQKMSLIRDCTILNDLLNEERIAAESWIDELHSLGDIAGRSLVDAWESRFDRRHEEQVSRAIRRIYQRYDFLARPRRYLRRIVTFPLTFFGLLRSQDKENPLDALQEVPKHIDVTPVCTAVNALQRSVLSQLSPKDSEAPLYSALREPLRSLSDGEVRQFMIDRQEELASWLAESIKELTRGISKTKEIGIYTTSFIGAVIILSFEVILGGGITVLEVLLDTFLAPVISSGSVNVFAYGEVKTTLRRLNERYREVLTEIVDLQIKRYEQCIHSVLTQTEVVSALRNSMKVLENDDD